MSSSLTVLDPATGRATAEVPAIGAAGVAAVAATARAAQPAWDALGFAGRAAVLRRWRSWLVEHRERVLDALVAESGKTRDDAFMTDLAYIIESLTFWTANAEGYLQERRAPTGSPFLFGRRIDVRYLPLGVIGVIGPWNFPLAMCLGDGIPALMAGNAVVLKPATLTPLSSVVAAEGFRAAGGPDGVLDVVSGPGTGPALVEAADMIMFTGSTATGKQIARQAAETLTPVSLELGGNDPMLVLDDADLDRAANAAMHFGMLNAGQVCQSVERVYVQRGIYDTFVDKLTAAVAGLRQGPDGAPGTVDVGALTDPVQVTVVREHVEDAVTHGARVTTGGTGTGHGDQFYAPTVLADCTHDMRVMREETFGPVVAVMPYDEVEDGVALANDSAFGLSASVFGRDEARALEIARRIEAGGVYVNDVLLNGVAFGAPFGGWKDSGFGSRNGSAGIRRYCRSQLIGMTDLAPTRELYYYPNDPSRSAATERFVTLMAGPAGGPIGAAMGAVERLPLLRLAGRAAGRLRR